MMAGQVKGCNYRYLSKVFGHKDARMSALEYRVFFSMLGFMDVHTKEVSFTIRWLAKRVSVSTTIVVSAIKKLIAFGVMEKISEPRRQTVLMFSKALFTFHAADFSGKPSIFMGMEDEDHG